MDFVAKIAEARILEAIERGELDDLPGKGRPLRLEDLSRVPADLRPGYIFLKNARMLPEELELRKEMVTLQRLIDACEDDGEARELRRRKSRQLIRYEILMERRRTRIPATGRYRRALLRRLGGP